jgi:hypothetical protein
VFLKMSSRQVRSDLLKLQAKVRSAGEDDCERRSKFNIYAWKFSAWLSPLREEVTDLSRLIHTKKLKSSYNSCVKPSDRGILLKLQLTEILLQPLSIKFRD